MDDHYYAIIMAGGGGTRLWPLSRKKSPKQVLRLFGEQTLFQIAIERLEGLFPAERILVVTVADQASLLQEQCPQIPEENYLIEPMPRGTASVVGLAALALQHRDPQGVMAILTADHYIQNVELFRSALGAARDLANEDYLVTLGIEPTYAATGYGYIQQGDYLGRYQGIPAYRALKFIEKPDEVKAQALLEGKDHAWNSGMFIWKVRRILAEFDEQMPELAGRLRQIGSAWGTSEQEAVLHEIWPTLHPETIDYGVMEGARQIAVLPAAGLGWNDVGSWDSLFEVLPADENGNIMLETHPITLDVKNSLIVGNESGRLVVAIGIKDLIVIDTGDALLICDKNQAQQVRKVVNELKERHQDQYL
ncbi:MAG: sugar phosphate nucleotidyltransferase [Chloroflexi bacterium]|nr:sugar phosphate nucleotidyltransferase [Chloroflexota bacterium]